MISRMQSSGQDAPNPKPPIQIADLLVSYLAQLNVEYVFGVPGGAIEPLYNALARSMRHGGPRPIVARHETGAAFMADGYFRQTGKLGVCCATTGPGATNLITGVASAYENQIPMLVITGQTSLSNFGRGALQESSCTGTNIVAMFQYCSRYTTLVSHSHQLENKLVSAVIAAYGTPRGPAHLSIPWDILRCPAPAGKPSFDLTRMIGQSALVDYGSIESLVREIGKARRLVFLIGSGCRESIDTITALAERVGADIIATPGGKGLIDHYHPLFKGILGFAGHTSARATLIHSEVDAVIAIGTSLGEWASNGWDCSAVLNGRLIHVDSIQNHLSH